MAHAQARRRPPRSPRGPHACRPGFISQHDAAFAAEEGFYRAGGGRPVRRADERRDHPSAARPMNAGPLEHFERWDIHNEGTPLHPPRHRRARRRAHRRARGARLPAAALPARRPLPRGRRRVDVRPKRAQEAHRLERLGERIVLTEHRYVREDVEHGLAFLVSVCEWAGVACPVARGLLALGSAVLGRDLRQWANAGESAACAFEASEMKQPSSRSPMKIGARRRPHGGASRTCSPTPVPRRRPRFQAPAREGEPARGGARRDQRQPRALQPRRHRRAAGQAILGRVILS